MSKSKKTTTQTFKGMTTTEALAEWQTKGSVDIKSVLSMSILEETLYGITYGQDEYIKSKIRQSSMYDDYVAGEVEQLRDWAGGL